MKNRSVALISFYLQAYEINIIQINIYWKIVYISMHILIKENIY
jgi:hypothetical protein